MPLRQAAEHITPSAQGQALKRAGPFQATAETASQ